jgi:acetyl esterase/lipase
MKTLKIAFLLVALAVVFRPAKARCQVLTEEDITLYRDMVYATMDGNALKLDIAVPKYLKAPAPAIVDIPGGAWRKIAKSAEDAVFYATYGFVGVSITHRTSDIAVFPAAVHDCKTVVRWLRAHAAEYGIDPDKIGVTGFSSGGHLAALLGTSAGDPYLEGDGGYAQYSSAVQAVVDHFGPTDFLRGNESDLPDRMDHFDPAAPDSLFLGGPLREKADLARLANPIAYVDPSDPPTLIGHGEMDGMVVIGQSELLFEAMKKAGVPTEFIRVKNAGHMYRPYKWDVEVSPAVEEMNRRTIDWFRRWLGEPHVDTARIPVRKAAIEELRSATPLRLFYRLTLELHGTEAGSFCRGRFEIRGGGGVLARGDIRMDDISSPEKRTFEQECLITGIDLSGKDIRWNFRGEVYDAELDKKSEIMFMQGETYDASLEAVGYHIRINRDGTADIEKKVYRKKR